MRGIGHSFDCFFNSFYKKNNIVFQIPARTVEHAVLSKIDSRAYVSQASEERHVRVSL